MNKFIGITLIFLLVSATAKSQYFTTGEDPASLKWRQILTPDFQLIYPEEFEVKAQEMAHYFEKVYEYGSVTLHHKPKKISVIFHTRTIQSNGLVGWAPKRIEIFTPPLQDIYAQDWLQQLVLHEFRHVVQLDKISSEVPLIVKALLGEQGVALITGLYLPFWFIEGDAVISETALSNSGRGRLPSFLMEHKAQVVEKGIFSFDKAYNGSYRDFVPDHYKLGYLLTGESRAKYGSDLWNNVIDRLSRKPWSVNPVNHSLKLQTGLNQEKLYNMLFDSLKNVWSDEDRKYTPEDYKVLTPPAKVYSEYRYNHVLESGEIISLKSGYNQTPRFVMLDKNGKEKTIYIPGDIFEESVGYTNKLITWSENVPDVRWNHSGKSLIRIFNTGNGELNTLIPDYKCFAPAISPDEHNVAVVETDFENHYYLSVYNLLTGALVKRVQTPDNNYLFSPVWKDTVSIYLIILTTRGKRLAEINPFTGDLKWLAKDDDLGELKQLCLTGDRLYFISSFSAKNELYSYHTGTGEIKREVKARFGVEYPSFSSDQNFLVLSDFTANGFRLIKMEKQKIHPSPINEVTKGIYRLAETLSAQEPGRVDFGVKDTISYSSIPFKKARDIFNFHSWAPFSLDIDSYELKPGISFASQNKLGTSVTTLGYKWNSPEKTGKYYMNYEYSGWYPIITAEANTGKRSSYYSQITIVKNQAGVITKRDTALKRFSWDQTGFSLDSRIPLDLTKGKYKRLLQPEVKYDFMSYNHRLSTPEKFVRGTIQSFVYRIYYHQLLRKAYRDIQPEWGWLADVSYRHSPTGDHRLGNMFSTQLKCYWPGILNNHGIMTYLGIQKRTTGEYSFSDVIDIPIGWKSTNSNSLVTASMRYSLPLFYPDLNFGKFIYIRRIRTSLFYDYGWLKGNKYSNNTVSGTFHHGMTSLGMDLTADSNFLRLYAPANFGIRVAYLPDIQKIYPGMQKIYLEFLFSVNFTSF